MASQPPPEFSPEFERELTQEIEEVQKRPLTFSIMGQTGVGKTSLLKALFNKALFTRNGGRNMVVDDVGPATREPETYTIEGDQGQILTINDLPGIGESSNADLSHFETYVHYLVLRILLFGQFRQTVAQQPLTRSPLITSLES